MAFLEQHNLHANILGEETQTRHSGGTSVESLVVILCCFRSGLNATGWAEGWVLSDFELLCSDGRRAALSEWESCNLGAIPPNTVMTRPVLAARVYDFLMKSQVSYV